MKLRKILNPLGLKRGELVVITCLVAVLEFFLNLWLQRVEYTSDPRVFMKYQGFPLEALKITNIVGTGIYPDLGVLVNVELFYEWLWGGVIINLIIYIVFSTFLVKLVTWTRDEIEYRRYYKTQ